ncbi:MAG: GNAT family N-acetyltransferase [Acidimicrobiia bacterium]|nr:GNAT family N-acetyltransferase [Acidimicrobiia bacterium]NNL69061.1 GNAT family N-acetyltransferase [Acidimicrobiia bacterium]
MTVRRFNGEYVAVAPLYDRTPEEVQARDRRQGQPLHRWIVWDAATAVAAVSTWRRPDDRLFLYFVGDAGSVGRLTATAIGELGRPVHTMADPAEAAMFDALRRAGFATEMVAERFAVRFTRALDRLRRAWTPTGYSVISAADADHDALFELDNLIRRDTPGTGGWVGDRAWFAEELAESPPFDPATYLVGVDPTGSYAGLVRIWRNPAGPRFGLIGVAPPHRSTSLGAALIRQGLEAASGWGYDYFVTETSLANRVMHPRLARLADERLGVFHQLIRRP